MAEVCCHFVGGADQGRPGPHALGGAAKAAGGRQGGAFVAPVAWKAACREAELLGCWPIGTIPWNWKMCAMRTGGALGAVGMGVGASTFSCMWHFSGQRCHGQRFPLSLPLPIARSLN